MTDLKRNINKIILACLLTGWVLLPLSHFKWLPNLGTTRPLSSFFFAAVTGLSLLEVLFSTQGWDKWIPSRLIQKSLGKGTPGWKTLRWWVYLIALGIISAAITPLYGNLSQALNRLLGYFLIFAYIYSAFYSLHKIGIHKTATWISLGYVPVLLYAIVEILAIYQISWALEAVKAVRDTLVVQFTWQNRMALLATEPSFVSFQMILLAAVWPYLQSRLLKISSLILISLSLYYTLSGTLMIIVSGIAATYILLWIPKRFRISILLVACGFGLITIMMFVGETEAINQLQGMAAQYAPEGSRLRNMSISITIRYYYILALIYTILDTYGFGVGIGQYGVFWKEIYSRHINPSSFDVTGEVTRALASPNYMRPWSVIFGIGADLGLIGMGLLGAFFFSILQLAKQRYHTVMIIAGILALIGAYPIVTPHVWITFGIMAGVGVSELPEE